MKKKTISKKVRYKMAKKTFDTSTISDLIFQEWTKCFSPQTIAAIKTRCESLERKIAKGKKQLETLKADPSVDREVLKGLRSAILIITNMKNAYRALHSMLVFLQYVYIKAQPAKQELLVARAKRYFEGLAQYIDKIDEPLPVKYLPKSFDKKEYKRLVYIVGYAQDTIDMLRIVR